ncbi:hypothetical protein ACVBEJ_11375 [Porticoccus sp. GXU_MW_L64]
MRWFLAVLVLANAVVFYWFMSKPVEPALPVVQVDTNVSQLMLLSERTSDEPLSGDCIVVGPIVELELVESLSAGLTARHIAHQRWSQTPQAGAGDQTYWLQFAVSSQSRLERRFWFDVLSRSPNTEISQKSCAAVASASDFP